jgi:hypothetical protein
MKAHCPTIIVLVAILAGVGCGTSTATHAAEQGSIQIRHRLIQDRQPGPEGGAQMSVEVGNLGVAAVEDLYISLDPTAGAPLGPPAIRIGALAPSQFKVFDFPVRRLVQVGNGPVSRLVWRIDYVADQKTRRQAQVHSVSPNQGIEDGGRP